eukprot:COSAG04_NODE_2301_length_4364_cov_1.731770_7_plen_96_part_00
MLRVGCRRTEGTIAPFRVRNPPDWSSAGRNATYLTATHDASKESKCQQTGGLCLEGSHGEQLVHGALVYMQRGQVRQEVVAHQQRQKHEIVQHPF